jgi:hypothetical protein
MSRASSENAVRKESGVWVGKKESSDRAKKVFHVHANCTNSKESKADITALPSRVITGPIPIEFTDKGEILACSPSELMLRFSSFFRAVAAAVYCALVLALQRTARHHRIYDRKVCRGETLGLYLHSFLGRKRCSLSTLTSRMATRCTV